MAEMEIIKETITVIDDRIPYLIDGIAKLNRRALKIGCPEMILTFDESTRIKISELKNGMQLKGDDMCGWNKWQVKAVWFELEATLEYQIPIIDGWELISTFDIMPRMAKTDTDGNVVLDEDGKAIYGEAIVFTSTVPGKDLPAEFLNKNEIHCDHCGHRRFRTHSMLMRHVDSGDFKEVGSTCVKDFFGHSPKQLLWMAGIRFSDIFSEIEDEHFDGGGRGGSGYHDIDTILQFTALSIRVNGWTSKKVANEYDRTSTSEHMSFLMDPPKNYKGERTPSEEDIELAQDTYDYFSEIDPGDNDYLANCKKVVRLGYVPYKMVGVTCSMIATFKHKDLERIEREKRPESNWVGDIKDKLEVSVKCVYSIELSTDWGVSVLYIFLDEVTGNKFKTFYSGTKWTVEAEDTMTLKGAVKKHETFRDEKSTILTRCSVSKVIKHEEKKDADK